MLTAIEGYYQNGHVELAEHPTHTERVKVVVTFLPEKEAEAPRGKRILGSLAGRMPIPDDFNDPIDYLFDDLKED